MSLRAKSVWALRLLGVVVILWCLLFGIRITRTETIRRDVDHSLSIGSSPEDVVRYLDARHLEHSDLIRPEVMLLGGQEYGGQLVIVAIKRHTYWSLLIRGAVQLIFVFDDNRKLSRADVFSRYTGL